MTAATRSLTTTDDLAGLPDDAVVMVDYTQAEIVSFRMPMRVGTLRRLASDQAPGAELAESDDVENWLNKRSDSTPPVGTDSENKIVGFTLC